ncbi:ARMADILLO REPEAT-CONTAINING PROTEIN 8 [Salix purpurea]|uniref:ARMADILLO REPEAT-CONTAINING PROTEIN 8 n=1 Tax=Salix purpurea TaxID=77065 RepID=A0A9Q0SVX5_SALPP|nr:ARMADILLO REPEAT-CONTAINING PROTEIN 8 [Salix purpurea]
MPTANTIFPIHGPVDLLTRLDSPDPETKLKALREIKNQIIGNRTKKLSFLKLGAVPAVASILSSYATQSDSQLVDADVSTSSIIVQSAAVLGSFACGFDAGVRAVLDAGAFPHLIRLLSNLDEKVVDASARSLRMIYQSRLAPKYEFVQEKNMEFLISLINSECENVTGLGASIITHSCQTSTEQRALCDAGILKKLVSLLEGSLSQKNATLESMAAVFKKNPEVISKFVGLENERAVESSLSQRDSSLESPGTVIKNNTESVFKFVGPESGSALSSIIELTKDRYARTRLLACMCLVVIRNASPNYLQDMGNQSQIINYIPKRLQGVLLALADLCSKLESCRLTFLSLKVLNQVIDALTHDCADVRTSACICLRSITRSIKNLCAGNFMDEMLVIPLIRLLDDPSVSVQVAALGVISNIVVDFTTRKSTFIQCGGVKQLVQLTKSMHSTLRFNALWALKNMMFLADDRCKEGIFLELTGSLLASLMSDPEPCVQEQALALVRNLVDGCIKSIEYVFAEDGTLLDAVGRQLHNVSDEVGIQGMYLLGNVASGNELHKEAVLQQLLAQADNGAQSFVIKFLQSSDSRLRTAAVWVIVNLTFPSCPGAFGRLVQLKNAGIISQIRNMVNDSCLDVKLRVRTVITQSMTFGDGLT